MFQAKIVLNGHAGPIYAASWDGTYLYSSSGDKYVTRWNIVSGLQDTSFTVKLEHAAYTLAVNSKVCCIGSTDGTLIAVDTESKRVLWEHNFFGNAWFSLLINEEKNWLIAGDSEGNLMVLDVDSGNRILHLPLAAGKIRSLSISNNYCFVCTQLIGILVFSIETWNEIASWEPNELGSNVILPELSQNRIITAGRDAHLVISDLNYQVIQKTPLHHQTIYGLIRIGNQFITSSMDKTIKVWKSNFKEIDQKMEFKNGGHNRSVNGLVFIDEQTFASYGDDKKIIVWKKNRRLFGLKIDSDSEIS
ncbi:WD40 repeat domain-containing protein [Fluviicola taffensis]|uniref:WD40 repeat-containing protein n=1 Tax=Fluviicola taffensis (strain DSM 16823 / NCIMB 13979 / RW262) TaxID=755732 RepID=F2IER1_FLUTR|nr:PQQ-binding-like beta-propeller repeat protein [Fluviicola taffensis]AEA45628.1 WD40 repeat-containing protein [Fluviicola taffensis DSM 16823]